MAMLPVGQSVGYGDASNYADSNTITDSPPTNADTEQSVRREGETSVDSESQKSWTRTHTDRDKPTFKDTLRKTQRVKSDTNASTPSAVVSATLPNSLPPSVSLIQVAKLQAGNATGAVGSGAIADPGAAVQGAESGHQAANSGQSALPEATDPKAQALLHSLTSNLSQSGGEPSTYSGGKQQSSSDTSGDVVDTQSPSAATSGIAALLQTTPTEPPKDDLVALSTPAERVAVATQVADHMSAMSQQANVLSAGGQHTVTINVHPDHWGELKISLSMDTANITGAKTVTATIIAGSTAVRDALVGQTKDLHDSLQSAGIKLDKLEITVANQLNATAPTHSASEMGFNSNSQNNTGNGQTASHGQGHTGSFSADTSGQQQRSGQQFASLFGDSSGFGQSPGGWQSAVSFQSDAPLDANSVTPISLVEATSVGGRGVNVLA